MPQVDLLIRNVGRLATPQGKSLLKGKSMDRLEVREAVAVFVKNGKIAGVISEGLIPKGLKASSELDAEGRLATPGLVDPHTHLVFAGSRHAEYDLRIRGASYLEIGRQGGGILSTVAAVRSAATESLVDESRLRVARMLVQGTCVVEVKSGYGLALDHEMKMLEAVAVLRQEFPFMEIVPTFLGAHEIPAEMRERRGDYLRELVDRMIPLVGKRALAEFCDVFCEEGVFSAGEARTILEAAAKAGMRPRIHADQFHSIGGTALACELKAASADHLAAVKAADVKRLARSGTVATVLPGSALSLGASPADHARRLVDGGAAVAIGTDCNPGSSHLESMPLAMAIACDLLRLTPAEALTAATLNAACALDRGATAGSAEEGKRADLILWDAEDYREIPYRFGDRLVHQVICGGEIVGGESSAGNAARHGRRAREAEAGPPPKDGGAGAERSPEGSARGASRTGGRTPEVRLKIWIDGAARGNPGPASAGVVIEDGGGTILHDEGYLLGETTNNVAEYRALLFALEQAKRLGAARLEIRSDSELLVKQVNGEYRVRHENLKPLHAEARARMGDFASVEIQHVRREQNVRADAAANRALDRA